MLSPTLAFVLLAPPVPDDDPVRFDRDVRPVLVEGCFACHGPDAGSRRAGLRLDTREGATADLGGRAAVVPGRPEESELLRRVTSGDPDTRMPPVDSHGAALDAETVALLERWIREGAAWSRHWAFVPPVREELPGDVHPIDELVDRGLARTGIEPAPEADAHTLARRLALDLTGLPPSPEDVRRLVDDPESWRGWIDELLDSPHHAERMAMWWLDGARYSDTDGYQQDATRTQWPWRDWVVDAFRKNLPFDRFVVEQIAGDLLPGATTDQVLATAFHRNHMTNGEGGRDAEESRVDYVLDRVNTTGALLLGLTLECAQCHDHKFDPVSQRDYYGLAAYFDSIDETGAAGGGAKPYLKVRSPYAQRAVDAARALLAESDSELDRLRAELEPDFEAWLGEQRAMASDGDRRTWSTIHPARLESVEGTPLRAEPDGLVRAGDWDSVQDEYHVTPAPTGLARITGIRLDVLPHPEHGSGAYSYAFDGEFLLTGVHLVARRSGRTQAREIPLARAVADVEGTGRDSNYGKVSGVLNDDPRNGWTTRTKAADVPHHAVLALAEPLVLDEGEELEIRLLFRSLDPKTRFARFRLSATDQRGEAVRSLGETPLEALARLEPSAEVPTALRERLFEQLGEDRPQWAAAKARHGRVRDQLSAAEKAAGELSVMVMRERANPRRTHVLERGVWDAKGEEVRPAVPGAVLPRPPAEVPTRLELAEWLVSRDNPLTARVVVNHLWQLLFGAGLVRTPDDFGQQGDPPTHPELLDWLAVELMESRWDLRHLIRTIATSATYRRSSRVDPALLDLDPDNRLLARGARFRMPSWMIRDGALAAGGLLNRAVGGPPVFPHQPDGVWRDQFMGRMSYRATEGPEQYRRTIYAFWRRTSAPAFLFDTATRRACEVVPRRTNTPLHALTLLNDRTAIDAARGLAARAAGESGGDLDGALRGIAWPVLCRPLDDEELGHLRAVHARALAHYGDDPAAAEALTGAPDPAHAALTVVANLVLNLDEALTRE